MNRKWCSYWTWKNAKGKIISCHKYHNTWLSAIIFTLRNVWSLYKKDKDLPSVYITKTYRRNVSI